MSHLFIFTIGPVQSFIAQARKTIDLSTGSRLLSTLCNVAVKAAKGAQIELIFPVFQKEMESAPNRFIGRIQESDKKKLAEIGKEIEDAVRDAFRDIAIEVLQMIPDGNRSPQFEQQYLRQVENHLDIYWLFYPENENGYYRAYHEMEARLGAIKNIRTFHQYAETGRKCSLDGERNALLFGEYANEKHLELNHAVMINADDVWMGKNEGLSAISFIKRNHRFGSKKRPSFISTAGVAMMDYVEANINKEYYSAYKILFNGGRQFDEQLCYQENLTEKYFEKQGLQNVLKKTELAHIQAKHKSVFGEVELPKYYALLVFDGDYMGKIVGGDVLKETHRNNLQAFQTEVSKLLTNYAGIASAYLQEPLGQVVYAGGDDFMGFINLSSLFDALNKLRTDFDKEVNQKLLLTFQDQLDESRQAFSFSFSAGLVIAHYKSPLHFVLQKARDMEKQAKNAGRDRLGIAVMKHSGEANEAIVPWALKDGQSESLAHLKTILQNLKKPAPKKQANFSETFIRSLDREFYLMSNEEGKLVEGDKQKYLLITLARAEINRLLKRSANVALSKDEKAQAIAQIEPALNYFLQEEHIHDNRAEAPIENFIELLKVCLFIKRETE
ncbi:MAG: type III-B CRISPR-associated protein Cas10/Cmr2 [Saprospiraceae bacterium]